MAIRVGEPTDPKLDALLAVARQAVTRVGEVDEATWDAARLPESARTACYGSRPRTQRRLKIFA